MLARHPDVIPPDGMVPVLIAEVTVIRDIEHGPKLTQEGWRKGVRGRLVERHHRDSLERLGLSQLDSARIESPVGRLVAGVGLKANLGRGDIANVRPRYTQERPVSKAMLGPPPGTLMRRLCGCVPRVPR